jgi:hypothetical protein
MKARLIWMRSIQHRSARRTDRHAVSAHGARTHESRSCRRAREVPDVTDWWDGDGIGDSIASDAQPVDAHVGDLKTGCLTAEVINPAGSRRDYWSRSGRFDGGAASAEEAAIDVIAGGLGPKVTLRPDQ